MLINLTKIKAGSRFYSKTGKEYEVLSSAVDHFVIRREGTLSQVKITASKIAKAIKKLESGDIKFQANFPKGISYTVAVSAGVVHAMNILGYKALMNGLRQYRSGMGRSNQDLMGFIDARADVGIAIDATSGTLMELLIDYANDGGKVFIDSGAVNAFRKGTEVDFDDILDKYIAVAERAGKNIVYVLPDIIGDAQGTVQKLREYRDKIAELASLVDASKSLIVPFQIKEVDAADFDAQVKDALGDIEYIPGIPSKEKALGVEKVEEVARLGYDRIHLLGMGARNRKYIPWVRAIKAINSKAIVMSDSAVLGSWYSKGRPRHEEKLARIAAGEIGNDVRREIAYRDGLNTVTLLARLPGQA